MKSIFSIFGGYKNFMATIAQFLLAYLLLPLICGIMHFLPPDMTETFITNILGEIKLFDVWLDLLKGAADQAKVTFDLATYFDGILFQVGCAVVEYTLIGMCIYLCKTLGTMLGMRGVPVLQTVIGVFLGCITIGIMKTGDVVYIIAACSFLFIANILLTIFVTEKQVVLKVLGIFVGLGVQSIIAGMACAYVAALMLIWQGIVTGLLPAIGLISMTAFPLLLALLIDYCFLTPKKERYSII